MSVFMLQDDFEAIGLSKGMREVAFEDAWARFATYDGSAREFFEAMKTECPHYFNPAAGDDTTEHPALYSLSAQGAHVKEHGEAVTRALLSTQGLKLGQIKQAKVDAADAIKGANNPYSDQCKLSPAEREARIASLIKQGGTRLASQLAKAAGKTITNQPLQPTGAARMQR